MTTSAKKTESILSKYEKALVVLCKIQEAADDYLTNSYSEASPRFVKLLEEIDQIILNS